MDIQIFGLANPKSKATCTNWNGKYANLPLSERLSTKIFSIYRWTRPGHASSTISSKLEDADDCLSLSCIKSIIVWSRPLMTSGSSPMPRQILKVLVVT